jgi:putative tricarboxylic transport membrane protein
MTLRRDHVAGSAFIAAGTLVLLASGDLPFGTLASPGAGMLPMLIVGLMMAFGMILLAQARQSPSIAEVDWSDLPHALRVVVVAAAAAALYVPLGFLLTIPLLLFALIFLVERRPLLIALAFSIGATVAVYGLFAILLRTPLPRSLLGL